MNPIRSLFLLLTFFLSISFAGCDGVKGLFGGSGNYAWNLPEGAYAPPVPEWNPITPEKVELGRHLFYSKDLSQDRTMSCGSCHIQKFGFSDRKKQPRGIPDRKGELHPRNSMALGNAAYYNMYTWANPVLTSFELQMGVPLFFTANAVRELGLEGEKYLERLKNDRTKLELFRAAFGPGDADKIVTEHNLRMALASFERTLLSWNSPYDRYNRGDNTALSEKAIAGMKLFRSKELECSSCHSGEQFSNSTYRKGEKQKVYFLNNGLLSQKDYTRKQLNEKGLMEFTLKQEDEGKFRVPTLRNIGVTYPYMHDGSIHCDPSLLNQEEECARQALGRVVDHYASGGKTHPGKDPRIKGFSITEDEKESLVTFLMSLTDQDFLKDPRFSDPSEGVQE